MKKLVVLLIPMVLVLAASVVSAADAPTVKTRHDAKLGTFLTDDKGMTLYVFKKDEPNESYCSDDCAKTWPPFTASGPLTLPAGVTGELSRIKRDDGKMQVAYNKQPLYYYAKDEDNHDAYGQGIGGVWFVALVGSKAGTPEASAAASPAASPAAGSAVTIKGFAFGPATLKVAAGTTVTWTNQDSTAHTVTGDKNEFDSGNLAPGKTFTHTFDKAGTFAYHCTIHPSMKATITVT